MVEQEHKMIGNEHGKRKNLCDCINYLMSSSVVQRAQVPCFSHVTCRDRCIRLSIGVFALVHVCMQTCKLSVARSCEETASAPVASSDYAHASTRTCSQELVSKPDRLLHKSALELANDAAVLYNTVRTSMYPRWWGRGGGQCYHLTHGSVHTTSLTSRPPTLALPFALLVLRCPMIPSMCRRPFVLFVIFVTIAACVR